MKLPGWKQLAWIAGGGVVGFAWYYFVGCTTGSCPISSNPYISTGYGALIGLLATTGPLGNQTKKKTNTE